MFICAASDGAHGGLVPVHLHRELRIRAAFLVAVALRRHSGQGTSGDQRITNAAGLLLAGLMLAHSNHRSRVESKPEALDA